MNLSIRGTLISYWTIFIQLSSKYQMFCCPYRYILCGSKKTEKCRGLLPGTTSMLETHVACVGQPDKRVNMWLLGSVESVIDVSFVGHTAKLGWLFGSIHLFGRFFHKETKETGVWKKVLHFEKKILISLHMTIEGWTKASIQFGARGDPVW